MEANAPSDVKRNGSVGPGIFPGATPLRFKKLMREHKKPQTMQFARATGSIYRNPLMRSSAEWA
jgi:hypothetical protein